MTVGDSGDIAAWFTDDYFNMEYGPLGVKFRLYLVNEEDVS